MDFFLFDLTEWYFLFDLTEWYCQYQHTECNIENYPSKFCPVLEDMMGINQLTGSRSCLDDLEQQYIFVLGLNLINCFTPPHYIFVPVLSQGMYFECHMSWLCCSVSEGENWLFVLLIFMVLLTITVQLSCHKIYKQTIRPAHDYFTLKKNHTHYYKDEQNKDIIVSYNNVTSIELF